MGRCRRIAPAVPAAHAGAHSVSGAVPLSRSAHLFFAPRRTTMADKFAILTGASTGIGSELAKLAAADGYDLLLVPDTPFVDPSVNLPGAQTLEVDLSTFEGVDR